MNWLDLTARTPERVKAIADCKGKVFRARVNTFFNAKGHFIYQERMIPLKRMSCPGCEICDWMDEYIKEDMDCGYTPIIEDPIRDGALYELVSYDHGGMTLDGYESELEFVFERIKENKKGNKDEDGTNGI
ncbi:hypothetical protein KAR91_71825 [Candidatus Pacearchaeota archaeon]|nr:hypothetical protein [Candidatus Pacearchaeota archaeon]